MNKFGAVTIVVVVVALGYLVMLLYMVAINEIISSVNATIATLPAGVEARMPGSQSGLLAIPWILWFVPGVLGMVIVVMILKKPS